MSGARIDLVGIAGLEELRRSWGWILALGVIIVAMGTVGLGSTFLVTLATVVFFGGLLIASGVLQALHGFWQRRWSGFFLDLFCGLLSLVVGVLLVINPAESALALTLVIAAFLLAGGIMRAAAALVIRFPHWGWLLFDGLVSIALGVMIWKQWPFDGLWVIGLFVSIQLLFSGWSLVMLALSVRSLPTAPST